MRGGRCSTGLFGGSHGISEPGQVWGICAVHGISDQPFQVRTGRNMSKIDPVGFKESEDWLNEHEGHRTPLKPDVKPKRRTRTG